MNTHIYRRLFPLIILLLVVPMRPSFAQIIPIVSPDTLSWTANDLTPKEVSINFRGAWQADVSACQGLYQFDKTSGYDMDFITVTPLSANASTTERHVAVVITRSNGAAATLHLIHQGAVTPDPEPEPETDPWQDAADDLATNHNWIQKTTVTAADGTSSFRDVEWYDGLGYRDQITLVGASTQGKSIVTPVVYDRMRRDDARVYLPFADNLPEGKYRADAVTRQMAYYASRDMRPFSEKGYEAYQSGRPRFWQREGDAWNAGDGHRITYNYRVNTAADGIWRYRIEPGDALASHVGNYPAGSLQCAETEGEHGEVVRTFTDALGRVVCVEQETGEGQRARTLYIRDIRDSLAVVIQPEGVKALQTQPVKDISLLPGGWMNRGISDSYCFIWKYDWRGNLLSEHTPGGGTVAYAYDSRNREVLRTDSRMSPDTANVYRMVQTNYDQYDRVTQQFYITCDVPIDTMRHYVDSSPTWSLPSFATSHFTVIRPLRTAEYFPLSSFSYPTTGNLAYVAESGFASAPETERVKGMLKKETLYCAPDLNGDIPASPSSVTRAYHYDSNGRIIQTIEVWSDNWTRRVSTGYSFTGDVLSVKESVTAAGGTPHVLSTQYTRDPRGRVLSCARTLDGQTLRPVSYSYDDQGRLAAKRAGTENYLKTTLRYDIHGWLDSILVQSGGVTDIFREELRYASASRPSVSPRYDGSPSEISYSHWMPGGGMDNHTWGYGYDLMNRLTGATHFVGTATSASLTDTERDIVYDLNGNITGLKRYNASGLANNLSFTLSGNRKSSGSDSSAGITWTDAYDAVGNLVQDGRQDLEIQWNILNLVSGAVTQEGSLTYARLSDGALVSSGFASGNNTAGKRYCGSFVFETGTGITTPLVESVAWDEGRVFRDSVTGAYRDCWFAGDHLGDVRTVLDISQSQSGPLVLEQNDYLPFGTTITNPLHAQMGANRWRYAGKEAFPELNLLDFGARLYDPFTARWTAVDPLAKKYAGTSPYAYCANNPVNLVDPEGDDIYRYDKESGQLFLYESNGDDVDQIADFKKDRVTGEFTIKTRRNGSPKLLIDQVEKGILRDGMDFHKNNRIEVGGEKGPSLEGVQSFLLEFSNMIDTELGGYYVSDAGREDIRYVTIGEISRNTAKQAFPGSPFSSFSDIPSFNPSNYEVKVNYHTHLSRFSEVDRLRPSSLNYEKSDIGFKKRQQKNYPTLKFLIITDPSPFYY